MKNSPQKLAYLVDGNMTYLGKSGNSKVKAFGHIFLFCTKKKKT